MRRGVMLYLSILFAGNSVRNAEAQSLMRRQAWGAETAIESLRITKAEPPEYTKLKTGKWCEHPVGDPLRTPQSTGQYDASSCADLCTATAGCEYFNFRPDADACYNIGTSSDSCPEGFSDNPLWDFYKLGAITANAAATSLLGTGRPATDTSGARSRSMLTVFIKSHENKTLALAENGDVELQSELGQSARWNLLDSGDGSGSVYIQSASRDANTFLWDSGYEVQMQPGPDTWTLSTGTNGHSKFTSPHDNILFGMASLLWHHSREGACSFECDFVVNLVALAWGRSSVDTLSSATTILVYLGGSHGRNLQLAVDGSVSVGGGWGNAETWNLIDAANGRTLIMGSSGKYLTDNAGTLEMTAWPNSGNSIPGMEWYPIVGQADGKMSFQSHRGMFLVDHMGAAQISSGDSVFNVGSAKKFHVVLKDVKFQLNS